MTFKIEQHFLNCPELYADDTYISDGNIAVVKEFLDNPLLKDFKNTDENLLRYVPYEKGEYWELPDMVKLFPHKELKFVYNKNFYYRYDYVELFCDFILDPEFYIIKNNCGFVDIKDFPVLKVFDGATFIGVINPQYKP